MRVENPLVQQSLVDSRKVVEKKDLIIEGTHENKADGEQRLLPFIPSPFGSSGVYSISSLKAAVDYHAKFLTVAQNNLAAADHASTIPKDLIDRMSGL